MAEVLIHLDGVKKVFVTDEVETHALAGIHLDIKKGEYLDQVLWSILQEDWTKRQQQKGASGRGVVH